MDFPKEAVELLERESLAYVATSDENGQPNVSLKGIVKYSIEDGVICFLDLFNKHTKHNLKNNPKIALSVVDYKNFAGYQFKGSAELIEAGEEFEQCKMDWHLVKSNRYRQRVDHNISKILGEKASEYDLPEPKYLIKVHVEEIIDLSPIKK